MGQYDRQRQIWGIYRQIGDLRLEGNNSEGAAAAYDRMLANVQEALAQAPGRVAGQYRSYTTGTVAVANAYPDGYAAKVDFDGGYLEPAMDFAKEAESVGAYGETVRDPREVGPALRRALAHTRAGRPAVVAVSLPRLLHEN